jgi:hypothetical protein
MASFHPFTHSLVFRVYSAGCSSNAPSSILPNPSYNPADVIEDGVV